MFLKINYNQKSENLVVLSLFFCFLQTVVVQPLHSRTTPCSGRFLKFLNAALLDVPSGKTNQFPKMADEQSWPRDWNSSSIYYSSFVLNTRTIRRLKRATTAHERELDWAQGLIVSLHLAPQNSKWANTVGVASSTNEIREHTTTRSDQQLRGELHTWHEKSFYGLMWHLFSI